MAKLMAMLSLVGATACSVVGIREEEQPKYTVVDHVGAVEIRSYAPRIAAETTVEGGEYEARSTGFRRVAAYIFGGNHGQTSIAMTEPVEQGPASEPGQTIAMTAPVVQAPAAGGWIVRFIMPSQYTLATLPAPDNPLVRLVPLPAEMFGVLTFSGSIAPSAVDVQRQTLTRTLQDSPWRATGEPAAWFYDPPWTLPFLRRNEVAVAVVRR